MKYDIVIVGAGPAGLTAAIYALRSKKSVLLIEKEVIGGNITHSPKVENYPGFNSISGLDLASSFIDQVMNLGGIFEFDEVQSISKKDNLFTITCANHEFSADSVILATGSKHRKLNLPNEDALVGHGICYCAVCDGAFYKDRKIAVIGGGNSALQSIILLSELASHLTVVQNLSELTGEESSLQIVKNLPNVDFVFDSVVTKLNGAYALNSIYVKNTITNEEKEILCDAAFVCIGQQSDNEAFKDVCFLDERGFIMDNDFACNLEGLYCAGDCRHKNVRQVVTATSDGAEAALKALKYLDTLK